MYWKKIATSLILLALTGTSSAQAQGLTCGDVYSDAVANVEVGSSDRTERSYYFNLYCEQNGAARSFVNDGGLSFPIEGLPISVTGSQKFSKSDLQNFCKVGAEKNYLTASNFSFERYVVEGALKSFNDCRALELTKVFVTHRSTPPEGVTVFVEFRGVSSRGTLDVVGYDSQKMECTTAAFSDDGESEKIQGSVRHEIGTKNISIDCVRKAQSTSNGEYYPGAEFRLSTSWGPYTVSLPPNTRLGFDLVSQAEAAHGELEAIAQSHSDRANEQARVKKIYRNRLVGMRGYRVYQGDAGPGVGADVHVSCTQHGGENVNRVFGQRNCRARGLRYKTIFKVGDHSGGTCGHTFFALICLGSDS